MPAKKKKKQKSSRGNLRERKKERERAMKVKSDRQLLLRLLPKLLVAKREKIYRYIALLIARGRRMSLHIKVLQCFQKTPQC